MLIENLNPYCSIHFQCHFAFEYNIQYKALNYCCRAKLHLPFADLGRLFLLPYCPYSHSPCSPYGQPFDTDFRHEIIHTSPCLPDFPSVSRIHLIRLRLLPFELLLNKLNISILLQHSWPARRKNKMKEVEQKRSVFSAGTPLF